MSSKNYFHQFIETAFDKGNYATDDVIAFLLPFLEDVINVHESNQVVPFNQIFSLYVLDNQLEVDTAEKPLFNKRKIEELSKNFKSLQFDVVSQGRVEVEVEDGYDNYHNLEINFDADENIQQPVYVKGYLCYEQLVGHHDEQTDIFCLGLILGSMSLSLNLNDEDDLKLFVEYRTNPVQFNDRIHPTISNLITEMTELDRNKRSGDLYDIVHRIKNYRDYDPERQTDLSKIAGWVNKELTDRSQFILHKLRNRLFDTSRRNRLLYYKSNMRFVNLTVSSVPMVLNYQSIRPDQLFTWNADVSAKVKGMDEIVLNKYLRFEDHQYLGSSLDKIRTESQRDIQEFGFSQLKLVISFLNWHNLKESSSERIQSPLLLIPVELKKTKRIKEDHYSIQILNNEAEVNPVLANQLKELYGIILPDFIDLTEMSLEQFYQILKSQIDGANQGIKLNYSDKPKIKLIHTVAKQTVSNYRRRIKRNGSRLNSYKNIAYSYQQEHFKPLGLEIFKQHIEPQTTYLEFLINDNVQLSIGQMTGQMRERELYALVESESNPYSWDFDICNIVLGNFNYKKMSLVRDYNAVIDNKIQHDVFDTLFNDQPKNLSQYSYDLNNPSEWNHVITADPTQTQAILHARSGESYIIQGPPGTGKSQTITNLIADFIARGKNVLFVCEKRAALDVVFHRLKQNGLDELCCYIHDSQSDKREFIKNLKLTYEDFSKNRMNLDQIEKLRTDILEQLNVQIAILQLFHSTQNAENSAAGVSTRKLIDRLIELKKSIPNLQPTQKETLPNYSVWHEISEIVLQLGKELEESGAEETFSEHPLSKVNDNIITSENPLSLLSELTGHSQGILNEINLFLRENVVSQEYTTQLQKLKMLASEASTLYPLAVNDNLQIVNPSTEKARQFDEKMFQLNQKQKDFEGKKENNKYWKSKLHEQDVDNAIEIASKYESSFFKFLNGSWRALSKQLKTNYAFERHQIKPKYSQILNLLKQEYESAKLLNQNKEELTRYYRIDDIDQTNQTVQQIRNEPNSKEISYLLEQNEATKMVVGLHQLNNILHQLEIQLQQCVVEYKTKSITALNDDLESISMNLQSLQDLLPVLRKFATLPENLKNIIRTVSLSPLQTEAAMAHKTLEDFYRENRHFATIDVSAIEKAVLQIQKSYKHLLQVNASLVRAKIRAKFLHNMEISTLAASQLSPEQKAFKKIYNEGRKILENEFGKSMRYKSIRELSTKESGLVLKDLKPVWLMSPLSVSDSLPLTTDFFDVVIFDEASQVTLEEGIPALYRSHQTIIVGDDKQMPPTNFFTANAKDPDDLEVFEEDDELLSADADSLLIQGARKLNSTMLSWHYRSRYETLISYSNHAFYEAELLTIPDKAIHHNEKQAIEVKNLEDAEANATCLYDRSISFHHLSDAVYEKRSNQSEAHYIALLVRELLKKKVNESIGIVAFSQEQQGTIEDALTNLAKEDKVFEALLEDAYTRTEEEQFVGLIIKNLENIQGDERDIIIMSVCYGFDSKKKMIMNFGPINKKGGEKRLNVLFSRAKKHMAVISSIKYHNITNEYNEGANYFRRFLQYAENISSGNMQMARTILDGLANNKTKLVQENKTPVIIRELKQRLQKLGYEVDEQIGQSGFRCSLAIKQHPEDQEYAIGILLDDEVHYSNSNLVEQYYQRPAILKSFGWKYVTVLSKDWLENSDKVIARIEKSIVALPEKETEDEELEIPLSIAVQEEKIETIDETIEVPTPTNELIMEYYEFTDEKSSKFWSVVVQEQKLIVKFGKIGTNGQTQVKSFENEGVAQVEKIKLVKEKIKKGYIKKG